MADGATDEEPLPPLPRTWGECAAVGRGTRENPCAFLTCRWHACVEVDEDTGAYQLHPSTAGTTDGLPDLEALPFTCVLAAADAGGIGLEEVGQCFGVTRERIRQIEFKAITGKWPSGTGNPANAIRKRFPRLAELLDESDSNVPLGAVQHRDHAGPIRAAETTPRWAPAPPLHANLPTPEAVEPTPDAAFWCGGINARVTVRLCCARQTARNTAASRIAPPPLHRECAGCDRGAALRARTGAVAPQASGEAPCRECGEHPAYRWRGQGPTPDVIPGSAGLCKLCRVRLRARIAVAAKTGRPVGASDPNHPRRRRLPVAAPTTTSPHELPPPVEPSPMKTSSTPVRAPAPAVPTPTPRGLAAVRGPEDDPDVQTRPLRLADTAITTVEDISPEVATAILENKADNRKVNQATVDAYVADMEAGAWLPSHQGIAIDTAGLLIDGEHRMWAVIQSGVTVRMQVTRGLPPESRRAFDNGKVRKVYESLHFGGRQDIPRQAVSWLRVIAQPVAGHSVKVSPARTLELWAVYGEAITWVLQNGPRGRPYNRGPVMAALVLARHLRPEETAAFMEGYLRPERLSDGSPVLALRGYAADRASFPRESERVIFQKTLRAVHAFVRGETLVQLKESEDAWKFWSGELAKRGGA